MPPHHLEPLILAASYGVTLMLATLIWIGSARAGLSPARRRTAVLTALAVLLAWQLAGHALARTGYFVNVSGGLGSALAWAIVVPVAIGLTGLSLSPTASAIVAATPLPALIAVQIYRVVGTVFLVLWSADQLPGVFALPAGIGDIIVGAAAPLAAIALHRFDARNVAWTWNVLGIADLVVAVATGFLSSPGTLQIFAHDAPNRMITAYPLALVPLYAVPVSFILHGLVWQRLSERRPAAIAAQ